VNLDDLYGQLGVGQLAGRRLTVAALELGDTGDLEDLTAPLDAVTYSFIRLDEGIELHRVSLAKKAVAPLRISTSSPSRRFSRRNSASSRCSSLVSPT
jgi:hypothetical protein